MKLDLIYLELNPEREMSSTMAEKNNKLKEENEKLKEKVKAQQKIIGELTNHEHTWVRNDAWVAIYVHSCGKVKARTGSRRCRRAWC